MTRKVISLALLFAVLMALVTLACGGKKESIVAKVGDHVITLGDFNLAYKSISIFNRPPLVTYEDAENFLKTLINKDLMVQESVAQGHENDEALARQMEQWRTEQSIRALFKSVAEENLEITLAEVEDYYRRSRVTVEVRHILLSTLPAAQDITAQLKAGGDFAALARQHSIDAGTSAQGGGMGAIKHGVLDPGLERVVFSLNEGEVSDPVQTSRGFDIVQVTKRTEPSMDEFEQERPACAAELRSRRRNENWNTYLANVRAAQALEFNDENVLWLNELLPVRGSTDAAWVQSILDADKARVLLTYAAGQKTVGDFAQQYGMREGVQPYKTDSGELIRSVYESEIVNNANYEEAKRRGLDATDTVVRELEKKKEEALVDLLFNDIAASVTIPEERLHEEYENQKDKLVMPERAKIQLIQVVDRALADKALARLMNGESFDSVARSVNAGRLADDGGMLDFRPRQSLPTELQSYAFERLKPGELTPVVPASSGFFIAKLVAKDPEHPMTFDEARDSIEQAVAQAERDKALADWLEKKKEEVGVTIYPEELNKLIEGEETKDMAS